MSEQSVNFLAENTTSTRLSEDLRIAREAQNLSQEEVAKQLMLKTTIIEALETNTFSNNIFTRGYIRSYAKLLKLPDEKVSAFLKHLEAIEPKKNIPANRFPSKQVTAKDKPVRITTYLIIFILLVLLVAWYFWQHNGTNLIPDISTPQTHTAATSTPVKLPSIPAASLPSQQQSTAVNPPSSASNTIQPAAASTAEQTSLPGNSSSAANSIPTTAATNSNNSNVNPSPTPVIQQQ